MRSYFNVSPVRLFHYSLHAHGGRGSLTGPGPYWGARWYADLDGDGKDDIFWRNDGSDAVIPGEPPVIGAWKVGFMNGLQVISWNDLRPDNSGWEIAETGDFNGDGKADLLWQHEDGRVSLALMNGATVLSEVELRPAGNVWRVNFLADLNGDGKSDILWEQPDGSAVAWTMDGTTMLEEATLVGPSATGPYLSPAGDLDGDGMDDLIWQTVPVTGNSTWSGTLMNGTVIRSQGALTAPQATSMLAQSADLNGDGKSDLLWQNADGSTIAWIMNGLTRSSLATLRTRGTNVPRLVPPQHSTVIVP